MKNSWLTVQWTLAILLFISHIVFFVFGGANLLFGAPYILILVMVITYVMLCCGLSGKKVKSADIIICNNCETRQNKQNKFCSECGAELRSSDKP